MLPLWRGALLPKSWKIKGKHLNFSASSIHVYSVLLSRIFQSKAFLGQIKYITSITQTDTWSSQTRSVLERKHAQTNIGSPDFYTSRSTTVVCSKPAHRPPDFKRQLINNKTKHYNLTKTKVLHLRMCLYLFIVCFYFSCHGCYQRKNPHLGQQQVEILF